MKYEAVITLRLCQRGRSPHGERGLKFAGLGQNCPRFLSLPSRGAWIEIEFADGGLPGVGGSLPSRGAWIEIALAAGRHGWVCRRSPHGERGLKSGTSRLWISWPTPSLPSRGAWIEISRTTPYSRARPGSLPSRGAWIEITWINNRRWEDTGRSPHGERGLKCEQKTGKRRRVNVAPLTGSVD